VQRRDGRNDQRNKRELRGDADWPIELALAVRPNVKTLQRSERLTRKKLVGELQRVWQHSTERPEQYSLYACRIRIKPKSHREAETCIKGDQPEISKH
jgi:hypothetical protein